MLGQTADALSAYMGCVVLAEVGHHEDSEWVIFARALGEDEESDDQSVLHVQMGGPDARMLGQQGGIDASDGPFDCAFLWAIELTEDPEERYIRLDEEGEIFDAAPDLISLLPFSLSEPEIDDSDDDDDSDGDDSDDSDLDLLDASGPGPNDTRH